MCAFEAFGPHLLGDADDLAFGLCAIELGFGLQGVIRVVIDNYSDAGGAVTSVILSSRTVCVALLASMMET